MSSLSAVRVPATEIVMGDRVHLVGLIYFTVEWVGRHPEDGSVYLAGTTSKGLPHVSSLSEGARVSRVFQAD